LDIQSGECRYGLQWLAHGVEWLPDKKIGTLIVTDYGDFDHFVQENKKYCEQNFGVAGKKILRKLIRGWVDYFWEFPNLDFDAISWCFAGLGLPRSPVDFAGVGKNIFARLDFDGIFLLRMMCEKISAGESLPRNGKDEEVRLRNIFGDKWFEKFEVRNSRELTRAELKLHCFSEFSNSSAIEIILQKHN